MMTAPDRHRRRPAPRVEGVTATVADLVDALHRRYPPALAEDWDAVGLVCGDPRDPVDHVLLAVDPVAEVVDEAIEVGAQLVVTHHPLLLRGVHGVPAVDAKGTVVHRLVRAGIALVAAHTNADAADTGVSDALAARLGVLDLEPLDAASGIGRVGVLATATTLGAFADLVAARLPATAHGVRVAGDLEAPVQRVAVCGGAGDSFLAAASAAGADVYVTSDLRHHRASEHLADGGCALVDVAHWAGEQPWLESAAAALTADLAARGDTVTCTVSTRCTDPWTSHRRSST